MRRVVKYLPILAMVLAAAVLIPHFYLQSGDIEWLFSISSDDNPLGKPTEFKVWAYDPVNLRTFAVSCNITIINDTDVVLMDQFYGNPAVFTFNTWTEGKYSAIITCKAYAHGNVTIAQFNQDFTYHYPVILISPSSVKWGRPFNLVIKAEYNYNKHVTVYVGGKKYTTSFNNGRAVIPNLVLYNDTTVSVEFLGKYTNTTITVLPPTIFVNATTPVKVKHPVKLSAWFADNEGAIQTSQKILYMVTGECGISYQEYHQSGTVIELTPTKPGTCTFTAVAVVKGQVISNSTTITVLPPQLTDFRVDINNVTPWKYVLTTFATTDIEINGNLTLEIDDKVVAAATGIGKVWNITKTVTLNPGVHKVTAKFVGEYGIEIYETRTIIVPRHPYNITVGDIVIPFGVDWRKLIPSNYTFYTVGVNKSDILVYVYYPGNWYYMPAQKLIHVKIVYPMLYIEENDTTGGALLRVVNGQPGALVTVYGVKPDGTVELLYQTMLHKPNITAHIKFNVGKYIAVYEYGNAKIKYLGNKPEPVNYISSCIAGTPCVPVASSEWIKEVYIGGVYYEPGKPIVLKEGEYLVRILEKDGTEIDYTLKVVSPVKGEVIVYMYADTPNKVYVDAPPGVNVTLVLESGRKVTVGPGEHTLPERVVGAYSDYFKVVATTVHKIP